MRINKIILPLIGALVFGLVFNQVQYYLYKALPMSFWVEYTEIRPANPYFVGEELEMTSFFEWKRPTDVYYIDTLKCLCDPVKKECDTDGFDTFSNYSSAFYDSYNKNGFTNWKYQGALPTQPTQCRVNSSIRIEPYPGVWKTQQVQGDLFDVLAPEERENAGL